MQRGNRKEMIIMRIRVIQYVDGFIKYDEVYEGFTYDELKREMDELKGEAFDYYEMEIGE